MCVSRDNFDSLICDGDIRIKEIGMWPPAPAGPRAAGVMSPLV